MPEPLCTSVGWAVLHLFCKPEGPVDREAVAAAVKLAGEGDHQVVSVALLGHKADVGFMALGPDLWRLRALQTALAAGGLAAVDSYVSFTEVSEYAEGMPEGLRNARLYPRLPPDGKRAFCFYPMSKRREADANWYSLGFDERRELMLGHGAIGRSFSGRVLQLITGSTGVDDFEWGVTLFAVGPEDLKEVVYKMRFDRASALFAEFGSFVSGMVAPLEEVLDGALPA